MWLSLDEYKSKLLGCWIGKNIGGTLGQPFEGVRGMLDISFYTQELGGEPIPNDDLDLQLVWLVAAERHGRAVDSKILGEYWINYIHPNWAEYGYCKNNMKKGIIPPLSGSVYNTHQDSNGAWIRSEIWACLFPGQPQLAASYACEDAGVDHCLEGVYSAAFCAAMESAAFVESDPHKLIDIALSYIPEDCGVRKGVDVVVSGYKNGLSWKETRKKLFLTVPDSFGGRMEGEIDPDIKKGEVGYDAPANIGIVILGWLYGEGDFGKSICMAVNCGSDTDCTAATLGAILGIIRGAENIPENWKKPIGSSIKTCCLNGDLFTSFPGSVDELTERIIKLAPRFMDLPDVKFSGMDKPYVLRMKTGEDLYNRNIGNSYLNVEPSYYDYYFNNKPFSIKYETPLYYVWFDYKSEPFIRKDESKPVRLNFHSRLEFPLWINIKWTLPEDWQISTATESSLMLPHHFGTGKANVEFTLTHGGEMKSKYNLYADISVEGRHTRLVIPITFYTGG